VELRLVVDLPVILRTAQFMDAVATAYPPPGTAFEAFEPGGSVYTDLLTEPELPL